MEIIQSQQNDLVKETAQLHLRKYREEREQFLVEGVRLVEEACRWAQVETVFFDEAQSRNIRVQELLHSLTKKGTRLCPVSSGVLKKLAETTTPQGIVAVVHKKALSLGAWDEKTEGLIVISDGLQDPGNLGTLIRTSWAAGVEALICLPGTVDPYGGKTLRASMGGAFCLPIITGITWPEVSKWCEEKGYRLVAGDPAQGVDYDSLEYPAKVALAIGNEGRGLSTVALGSTGLRVKIPLQNEAESLNAAVASGILIFEMIRQRRKLVTSKKVVI